MSDPGARVDPARNFNFIVEIDGFGHGQFLECSGLETTTEVIETREGGDNTTVRKLPGKTTYADVTLRRGVTTSLELWSWRNDVTEGTVNRKNGAIVLYDLANSTEVARWNFVNAWPTKWDGPQLNAKGTDIAVETLVLAVEGLTRVKV
jgi:phage tail-like protein